MPTDRSELEGLLRAALGDRTAELLMDEIDDRDDEHDDHDGRLDDLDVRFNSLSAHMDQQFAHVRDQFAEIDRRFEQIDHRFEQIDRRFEQVDHRFDTMQLTLENAIMREVGGIRQELVVQTRTLMIGIPGMLAAMGSVLYTFFFLVSRIG